MLGQAEYIWIDGAKPSRKLRSKSRVIHVPDDKELGVENLPSWGYDGSSTYQASGSDSDLELKPVCVVRDPLRGEGNFLAMCEVFKPDGAPHPDNKRAQLRQVLDDGGAAQEPWFGFEQEYTLFQGHRPLGWPDSGYPAPQGPFYCGVGSEQVFGRELVEAHMQACLDAGIMIYGLNAEVMPGQWEFQIGYRAFEGERADPLTVADHVWLARWLLYRIGEDFGILATLDNKPMKGDWNGAGCHTNFSTKDSRKPDGGLATLELAIERLSTKHEEHIKLYGHGLDERLTGLHETCAIDEFRAGVADRGASIRLPRSVSAKGYGYLEDRRPGANCDPYVVCAAIVKTACDIQTLAITP